MLTNGDGEAFGGVKADEVARSIYVVLTNNGCVASHMLSTR